MAAKYWIKLYHEMLHDYKVAELDDRLWRRFVECLLFAGEEDNKGFLPALRAMRFVLNADIEQLETELNELVARGLLQVIDGRYHVRRFADRQKAMKKSEYMRRLRDERQRDQYHGEKLQDSYQPVTKSNAEKIREDKNREEAEETPRYSNSPSAVASRIYTEVTGQISVPSSILDDVIADIESVLMQRDTVEETIEYLRPYYQTWITTKGKNGRLYSKTNPGWLEWAIAGEMPGEINVSGFRSANDY